MSAELDDDELTHVIGCPAGVSAVTQRGAVVSLEFLTVEQQNREAEGGNA